MNHKHYFRDAMTYKKEENNISLHMWSDRYQLINVFTFMAPFIY